MLGKAYLHKNMNVTYVIAVVLFNQTYIIHCPGGIIIYRSTNPQRKRVNLSNWYFTKTGISE